MAAADETSERYGEAGQRLAEKRAKLAEAEAALASAKDAMDEEAVMQLQSRVTILGEFIERLEVEERAEREVVAKRRAAKRLVGIRRAHGSARDEYGEDIERLRALHVQYAETLRRLNGRFAKLARELPAEFDALVDRFDLSDEKALPAPIPPAALLVDLEPLPALAEFALPLPPATEQHEEMPWRRRTYSEIAGTPGFEQIIQLVGPKPWRSLTPNEEWILGIRRERAQRDQAAGRKLGTPLALPGNTAIGTI